MTIHKLNQKLDQAISDYEKAAGNACSYCDDVSVGDALSASHKATANALSSFKAEILTYFMRHNF